VTHRKHIYKHYLQSLKFQQCKRKQWRRCCSGLWRRVVSYVDATFLRNTVSIFRTEDKSSMFLLCWCLPSSPHGVTTHKNNIDIFTAERSSNLTKAMAFQWAKHNSSKGKDNSSYILYYVQKKLPIREVPGSNNGPETGYPDWSFRGLPQSRHGSSGIVP
jgi:hypothetical protein